MAHNKSLYQLPGFWAALFIPLTVAVVVALWIAWHSLTKDGYSVCGSAKCINGALVMMKLPLGILALVFPSVALVASHHRSVQTAAQITRTDRQIQATEQKNAFENYIKHKEMFGKHVAELEDGSRVKFSSLDMLYKMFFPDNSWKNFSPFTSIIYGHQGYSLKDPELRFAILLSDLSTCKWYIEGRENISLDEYMDACNYLSGATENLNINLDGGRFSNPECRSNASIIEELKTVNTVFYQLCDFAFESLPSEAGKFLKLEPTEDATRLIEGLQY